MADFIKLADTRGALRRVNTRSIIEYRPIPERESDGITKTEIFLEGGRRIDTAHNPEAIDKALEAPGRIVTLT